MGELQNPTKVDRILPQMKIWDVDLVLLAEMCVDWTHIAPRRAISRVTWTYEQQAC